MPVPPTARRNTIPVDSSLRGQKGQAKAYKGNGEGTPRVPGKKTIADCLRGRIRRAMPVVIGTPEYEADGEDQTGSFVDLAERIDATEWLIPQWVPQGMLIGLIGPAKFGKSSCAMWCLVRPVVVGCNWFNGRAGPDPGVVVWCDTERRARINLERAKLWQLPMERIKTPFNDPLQSLDLDAPADLERLHKVICRYKARLVVIDSFRGGHKGDENNSRIVVPLRALATIAEETNTAMVLIHHTGKSSDGQDVGVNAARGSSAFLAMVACQLVIDRPDPQQPNVRRFRVEGENLGIRPEPVGFTIIKQGLTITAAPAREKPVTQKDRALQFLTERMQPGEWYSGVKLLEEAKQFSLSGNAVQRAREELGITEESGLVRRNTEGKYEWRRGAV